MFKQTIRANIITVFLLLLSFISFAIVYAQYYFNSQLAVKTTTKTFELVEKNILDEVNKDETCTKKMLLTLAKNRDVTEKISFDTQHGLLSNFLQVMEQSSGFYASYILKADGSFYELINMNESKKLYTILGAPKETRWTILTKIGESQEYTFMSKEEKILGKRRVHKKYSLLEHSWYKEAVQTTSIAITKPYIYKTLQELGVTYAKETLEKGTVVGIDYSMKNLKSFLTLQKFDENSEVFLFSENGNLLISSSSNKKTSLEYINRKIDPSLEKALTHPKKNLLKYTHNGIEYLSMFIPLDEDLYLGVKIDTATLYAPYKQSMKYSLLISLALLLLSIPIVFFAADRIAKPVRDLIRENEEVKLREFDKVEKIETNILEFIELSASQVEMSHSISEYEKAQENMLDAIVKLIAEAVDAKSPYTGGHCKRVPEIAQMLVAKASEAKEGIFKEFTLESEDALREFEIGAWLHDCGKVTTPEYVVDKSTKLETITDRIHEVRTRFEVLWHDAQISYLEVKLAGDDAEMALELLHTIQKQLVEEFEFIASANIGGEYMSPEKQTRVRAIAKREWMRHFDDRLGIGDEELQRYESQGEVKLPVVEQLLSDKQQHLIKRENFDYEAYKHDGFKEKVPEYLYNHGEVYNLCIKKGTLSAEERYKINEHIIMTIKMLEKIPFPSGMSKIPEYAGTHHETLIGSGYPRKLTKEELSIPARIMALSDVFEALTASDRPYKKAKTLSESVKILSFMVKDEHLDADIFKLFLKSDLYNVYAKMYLSPEQIDEVDITQYLL